VNLKPYASVQVCVFLLTNMRFIQSSLVKAIEIFAHEGEKELRSGMKGN